MLWRRAHQRAPVANWRGGVYGMNASLRRPSVALFCANRGGDNLFRPYELNIRQSSALMAYGKHNEVAWRNNLRGASHRIPN